MEAMMIDHPVDDETRQRFLAELEARTAELTKRVELERARSRKLGWAAAIMVSMVVLASLLFGALVIQAKTDAEHDNGDRLDNLTAQLTEARDEIASRDQATKEAVQVNLERSRCTELYGTAVSEALAEVLSYVGDLVLTPTQEVKNGFVTANDAYKAVIAARAAWQADGSPTPCPLTE